MSPHDESSAGADQRVGGLPPGQEHDQSRGGCARRPEDVGGGVDHGPAQVQVVARRCPQHDEHRDAVRDDADEPDDEDAATRDVGRLAVAAVGLDEDADADHDQRQAVHERGEDLGPPPAERPRPSCRQPRGPRSAEGERDRRPVGDVVHRVGDQGEAVEPDPCDDLDEPVGDGQAERDRERPCRSRPVARMRVGMRVRMRVHHTEGITALRRWSGPANMIAR